MKESGIHFSLIILVFLLFVRAEAQNITSGEIASFADSLITEKMNAYKIPGMAIGIIQNDSILLLKGYGINKLGEDRKIDENTVFHTASVSKLIIAQAIANLTHQKILNYEDELITHLPALKYSDPQVEKITIRQLLNHTSGLGDITNYHWKKGNEREDALREYLFSKKIKLKSAPGTSYSYSNVGYDLLGLVIAEVTKQSFEDYIQATILDPAGMKNSDFRYFNIEDSLKTYPHSKKGTSQVYVREVYPYTREHAPSSTLNSSVSDMVKWMQDFLSRKDMYEELLTPHPKFPYIGLGFQLSDFGGIQKVGHYGGDRGFRSYLILFPEEKTGLVLLANADFDEDFRQEILHPIARVILKKN